MKLVTSQLYTFITSPKSKKKKLKVSFCCKSNFRNDLTNRNHWKSVTETLFQKIKSTTQDCSLQVTCTVRVSTDLVVVETRNIHHRNSVEGHDSEYFHEILRVSTPVRWPTRNMLSRNMKIFRVSTPHKEWPFGGTISFLTQMFCVSTHPISRTLW